MGSGSFASTSARDTESITPWPEPRWSCCSQAATSKPRMRISIAPVNIGWTGKGKHGKERKGNERQDPRRGYGGVAPGGPRLRTGIAEWHSRRRRTGGTAHCPAPDDQSLRRHAVGG